MPADLRRPIARAVARAVAATLAGVLVLACLVVGPASASFAASRSVARHGQCSGPAEWRLEARKDYGRIEVRGEVDTRRSSRRWRWRILHDGGVSAHGIARTDGGGFSVRRRLVNAYGPDRIGWRARNLRSGQICRGGLRI